MPLNIVANSPLTDWMSECVIYCVHFFFPDRWINMQVILITTLSPSFEPSCYCCRGMFLSADAVIGSQGELAQHNLISPVPVARRFSLLFRLPLERRLLCCWGVVCRQQEQIRFGLPDSACKDLKEYYSLWIWKVNWTRYFWYALVIILRRNQQY